MTKRVVRISRGEGVASWVRLLAIVGTLMLILTTMSFAPSRAQIEETQPDTEISQSPPEALAPEALAPGDAATPGTVAPESGEPATPPRTELPGGDEEEAGDTSGTSPPAPAADDSPAPASTAPSPAGEARQVEGTNPAITVGVTEILVKNGTAADQITVGESVSVSGTWDATKADPQPGQKFTVGFPAELAIPAGQTFPLDGADGTSWATCEVNADNTFTCTLSEAVVERPHEVQGTWQLWSTATGYTAEEAVNFDLNGTTRPVDLPGEGGISDGFEFGETAKSGKMRADQQSVQWTIDIPGPALRRMDPEGTGTVVLTDELSVNMQLCAAGAPAPTLQLGRDRFQPVSGGGVTVQETAADGDTRALSIQIKAGRNGFQADQMYQIDYVTCTSSEEVEQGAEYRNTVEIDGRDYGAGVRNTWTPQAAPSKAGQLTQNGRWGTLNWTVSVPGLWLNQNNASEIVIDDTLSGAHAVCADGLRLGVSARDQLPALGQTTTPWRTVTGNFTLGDDAAAGDRDFSITATPKEGTEFDPAKIYRIDYVSCVTLDEIPDNRDTFQNTAVVNGTTVTAATTGRSFGDDKYGHINYAPTTIAGEEFPAGTTLDWTAWFDGYLIEDTTEPFVLTDTFSANLAVCEIDGLSLPERLNLKVTARDYVDSSVTEDLTLTTQVTQGAKDELVFTLPRPEGHYSRNWVYQLDYTLCTASGGVDSHGTEYDNTIEGEGVRGYSHQTSRWGAGGTGQGVARGSFSLSKSLHEESEGFAVDAHEFIVQVEEFAPGVKPESGTPDQKYTVTVKADESPVSGYFARGTGWTIRLSEIGFPEVSGLYFEPGQFQASEGVTVSEDGTQATFTIKDPRNNLAVHLENKASLGGAEVTKKVIGDAAERVDKEQLYALTAYVDTDADGTYDRTETNAIKDGQTWTLPNLPIGTRISFSETQPENTDEFTWSNPVFTPPALTIGADQRANTVEIRNEVNATQGTFSVRKQVTGEQQDNPAVPATFPIIATWTDPAGQPQESTLNVPTNGDAVPYPGRIPAGTQVTLRESLPDDGEGIAWGTPTYGGPGVTTTATGEAVLTVGLLPVEVTVQNHADTHVGDLRITKDVIGAAATGATGANFRLRADLDYENDGQKGEERYFTLQDGEYWLLEDLPIGTKVSFTEELPANSDAVTWGEPHFVPGHTVIVDDAETETTVTLTNQANITEGTFSVHKKLTGPERDNDQVPATFTVLATWLGAEGTGQTRELLLPADGTPVDFPERLPAGTEVTLREIPVGNGKGLAWSEPTYAGDRLRTDAEGDAVLTIGLEPGVVEVKNYVDVNDGTFRVLKQISGEAAEAVTDAETFTVQATWELDGEFHEKELEVTPGKATDLGVELPMNTKVTFTESERPEIAGVEWGTITWSADPTGQSWLQSYPDGTAAGFISDDPEEGRLITLGNEALWQPGSVGFEKLIDQGGRTMAATAAKLPEGAEFEVRIDSLQLPAGKNLPEDAGIAVGDILVLNAANDFRWQSEQVLPRGTTVTFTELDPLPLPGVDWGMPSYEDTLQVEADGEHIAEITNRLIPTTVLDIDKSVTGPKGRQVERHASSLFQVTASWTDIDNRERSCVLNVRPGQPALPTEECDATLVDGEVQFPLNTEITFEESGAYTEVNNVEWGEVRWSVADGRAKVRAIDGAETSARVTLTGAQNQPVSLGLENKTSSTGLIFFPLPILPLGDDFWFPPGPEGPDTPLNPNTPGWTGAPALPSGPGDPAQPVHSGEPDQPETPGLPSEPGHPGAPTAPGEPGESGGSPEEDPGQPGRPGHPGQPGVTGADGQPLAQDTKKTTGGLLADTGANVLWLTGGAVLLLLGGAWLTLRGRKERS